MKQIFSIVDGRLSTRMEDIYNMLNAAFDDNFTTLALPIAMTRLKAINPPWFQQATKDINDIKDIIGDDFETLMAFIDEDFSDVFYEIVVV